MYRYFKLFPVFFISSLILFFASNIAFTSNLYAGDSTHVNTKLKTKRSVWGNIVYDLSVSVNDAGKYFTAPIHFTGKEWLYTAGLAAGTVSIMTGDKEVKTKISRNSNSDYHHDFWDVPTAYGYTIYPAAFGGLVYAAGLFTGHDNVRITGRLILESIAFAGIVAEALKVITGRTRPYYTDSQWDFKWFKAADSLNSFPAGHTTVAFAFSTILAERIGTWWSRVLFYGLASLTAYARVLNNQHWLSDVVFGGLLGFGTGWFVLNRENEREKALLNKPKNGGSRISLYPSFTGLSLIYRLN
jgi:membrane-associated phospholipid phosphatase